MDSSRAPKDAKHRPGRWRLAVLAAIVGGAALAAWLLPLKHYLDSLLHWVAGLGAWGPVVVVGIYVVSCVLFLPGSVITLGVGFLFGVVKGTILVSAGSTLGACAAFLVGRTIARGRVARKVAGNGKFAAIDEAVGRHGFKIVLLTRLSPIFPFNLLNYAFGLTAVPFWTYALASWIGMLPGTVMYVYLGSAAREVTTSLAAATAGPARKTMAQEILFWAGLAIAIAVAVLVTRIARKALKEATRRS